MRIRESANFLTHNTRPTWLLELPPGLTIQGAVAAYHRLWGYACRDCTRRTFFGFRKLHGALFDGDAEALVSRAFPYLTPRQLIERHTLFGFYSPTLDPLTAERWAGELIRGEKTAMSHLPLQEGGKLTDATSKYCPICVGEDIDQHGFGLWRLIHYVPGITHCPKHRIWLLDKCSSCGRAFTTPTSLALPGDRCQFCKARPRRRTTVDPRPGPVELAAHAELLGAGELQALRPDKWAGIVRHYVSDRGGADLAAESVVAELTVSWGLRNSPAERKVAIERELRLWGLPGNVVMRLVIFGSLLRQGYGDAIASNLPGAVLDEVEAQAARRCVPIGIVPLLGAGLSRLEIKRLTGVPVTRTSLLEDLLPKAHRRRAPVARVAHVVPDIFRIPKITSDEQRKTLYRKKILWALENWEDPSRTDLWRHLSDATHWLSRHDAQWMKNNLPPKIGHGSPRKVKRKPFHIRARPLDALKPNER